MADAADEMSAARGGQAVIRDNTRRVAREWWHRWSRLWTLIGTTECLRFNLLVLACGSDSAKESAAREVAMTITAFGTQSIAEETSIEILKMTMSPWKGV